MPDLSEFPGMQMPEFKQEPINVKKITKCTKQDGKYVITVEAVEGESGNEIVSCQKFNLMFDVVNTVP